jgi:DNA-directed RNA polymerase specialized sigma24 family protein/DNA-binding GntR family transcriptional regulator
MKKAPTVLEHRRGRSTEILRRGESMQVKSIAAPGRARGSLPQAGPTVPPSQDVRTLFEGLFAEYFPRIRRSLAVRVRDVVLAEELAQRMFADVWEQAAGGSVDLAEVRNPYGWLLGRARVELTRHRGSRPELAETGMSDQDLRTLAGPVEGCVADRTTDRVMAGQLILALPLSLRRVMALHLLEDLSVDEVARETGQTAPVVVGQIQEGIARVRSVAGVRVDDIAARAETEAARECHRRLSVLGAGEKVSRSERVREALRAAIAGGAYAPGEVMPPTSLLAALYAPSRRTPWDRDTRTVLRILNGFARDGLLTRSKRGFEVTAEASRLAAGMRRTAVSARQMLARELLDGVYAPGEVLPAQRVLANRWGCEPRSVWAALGAVVDLGALTRTATGHYQVTAVLDAVTMLAAA